MTWQGTPVSRLSQPCSESESKRLRAYESLIVAVTVIVAVLVLGSTFAIAMSSTVGHVARSISPGP